MANWDVGCYPIYDPVEVARIMCALDPEVLNALWSAVQPLSTITYQ
jgi:hypothetical protein